MPCILQLVGPKGGWSAASSHAALLVSNILGRAYNYQGYFQACCACMHASNVLLS